MLRNYIPDVSSYHHQVANPPDHLTIDIADSRTSCMLSSDMFRGLSQYFFFAIGQISNIVDLMLVVVLLLWMLKCFDVTTMAFSRVSNTSKSLLFLSSFVWFVKIEPIFFSVEIAHTGTHGTIKKIKLNKTKTLFDTEMPISGDDDQKVASARDTSALESKVFWQQKFRATETTRDGLSLRVNRFLLSF